MALYTLPPPNSPLHYYVSSVPTLDVQCQALETLSLLCQSCCGNDNDNDNAKKEILYNMPSIYLKHVNSLERIMYLICTGGGMTMTMMSTSSTSTTKEEAQQIETLNQNAKKLSMYALNVLRNVLSNQEASLMVMHTLAPSNDNDNDNNSNNNTESKQQQQQQQPMPPPDVPVVQKLVNTLGENLHYLLNDDDTFISTIPIIDLKRMQMNIIGSCGALGVFLNDVSGVTTREMLFQVTLPPPPPSLQPQQPPVDESVAVPVAVDQNDGDGNGNGIITIPTKSLVECIMSYLENTNTNNNNASSKDVTIALMRLLMEWIPNTHQVISAILSSPSSVTLGLLLQNKTNVVVNGGNKTIQQPPITQAMTGVLLGLCMEYMKSDDDLGGWSISSIMNLINVGLGIGKFTQLLEGVKGYIQNDSGRIVGPWTTCPMERMVMMNWYTTSVNIVRKKAVQELSLSNSDNNNDDDDDDVGDDDDDGETVDGLEGDKSGKKKLKSLSRLVSHQSSEIESLRQKLNETEKNMTSQAAEMNRLKKRIGSNPNKLDEMLDEYTNNITRLEKENQNLKDEMIQKDTNTESTLKEKENELSLLKNDLDQSHEKMRTILLEKDTMHEEMLGLSAAYSNLESEYNRINSGSDSGQAIGDTTMEIGSVSNIAYQALKSENVKLKGDIRAANDWMSKAVKKMDELGKRNSVLESEKQQLKNEHSSNGQSKIEETNSVVEGKLYETQKERDELLHDIKALEKEKENSNLIIQEMRSKADTDQVMISEMCSNFENEKRQMSESISNMKAEILRKDEDIAAMQQKTVLDPNFPDNEAIKKLQGELQQLKAAYKAAQDWMANAAKQNEKLKSQVDELKGQNTSLKSRIEHNTIEKVPETSESESAALRQKLSTVSAARDEAIEITNRLEIKLSAISASEKMLTEENSKLIEQSADLSKQAEKANELQTRLIALERDLTNEREKYSIECTKLKQSFEEKEEANEMLQQELHTAKSDTDLSLSQREEQHAAFVNLQNEVETLRQENDSLLQQKDEHVAAIEEMRNRLTEFQTWTETAQQRFAELESEKDALQDQIGSLESNEIEAKQELADALENLSKVKEELDESKNDDRVDKSELEKLQSEILSLQVQIGNLDGQNRALSEDNKVLEKKNTDLTSKSDLLDEVEENLFEKENEVSVLHEELNSTKGDLESLQQESENAIKTWREKTEILESDVREKETQLVHQEAEAREAISKWQERFEAISSEIARCKQERDEVENRFVKLEAEISSRETSVQELSETIKAERDQNEVLSKQIMESEDLYKNHIHELEHAIQEHVDANEELETQLDERDEALVRAQQEIELLSKELEENTNQSEEVVSKWQENGEQLQATIDELEATIESQNDEANAAISQWEARCEILTEQIEDLEQQLQAEDICLLKSQLVSKDTEYLQALDKMNTISAELKMKNDDFTTLESDVLRLEEKLITENAKYSDLMSKLQVEAEDKVSALNKLEKERQILKELKEALQREEHLKLSIETSLSETKQLFEKEKVLRGNAEQKKLEIEEALSEQLETSNALIQKLEEEKLYLEESTEIDKAEANEMRLIIGQLESELSEVNDSLQTHLTDEVAARATEMATNALRIQLKESRDKQLSSHEAYAGERDARLMAEQEVERLTTDLSLLVQVDTISESSDSRIHQLTSKAAGEIMVRDRTEIDSLTRSLDSMMQELQICQSRERDAEERAANSRLHASACEQELMSAKSDICLLKDSIGVLKNDELDTRTSLEQCVKSLEADRQNIVISHSSDLKNLKAEIAHIQMERDRLIHALNESEKANSALVYSTTVDRSQGSGSSAELELAKLRLEKAQLLAAVQANGSKTEQRIRNVVSGDDRTGDKHKSIEAESLEASEKSLNILQQKFDDTSAELERSNASNADLVARLKESNVSELKNALYRLENDVSKMQKSNEELKEQLARAEEEATETNLALKEKCKLADAKIREMERQERKEAAVAAEVARIRDETLRQKPSLNDSNGHVISESKEPSMAADEVHDFVIELKDAVKEERKMYHDLLAEHEDLLALLAQQDLERTSLQSALTKMAGPEAVNKAISEAEERANEQFGKYIKLR